MSLNIKPIMVHLVILQLPLWFISIDTMLIHFHFQNCFGNVY
jgi:hypothetical protein